MKQEELPTASAELVRSSASFAELMDQLQDGSESAAWTIVDLYSPHILRVVRRTMPKEIRSKVDSVDLVNTLLGSILLKRTRIAHIREPAQLVAFLTRAAKNRVIDEHRHYTQAASRSVRSEENAFDERSERASASSTAGDGRYGGRESTPSQIAVAKEKWDRLLVSLSRRDREVVALRIRGKKYAEISQSVDGVSARTARRIIADVTAKLLA